MQRLVFVDTSEFIGANFAFSGARLATLSARMSADDVSLGMPEITRREIHASIQKAVGDAAGAITKARNDVRVLRNSQRMDYGVLFSEFPQHEIVAELQGRFEGFLAADQVRVIGIGQAKAGDVFDLYFARKPPFGDGKKKAEFPDAFTLSLLSEWGKAESKTVLVASSDSDLMSGVASFENLEYAGTLEQLLGRLSKEIDELTPAAYEVLHSVDATIEGLVCDEFSKLGFLLDDQDGDVGNVRALEASIEASLLHVEETGDGNAVASFDLTGTVAYEADLTYDDLSSAVYDSEDRALIVLNTVEETVSRMEEFQSDLTLIFEIENPSNVEPLINWGSSTDVNVTSSDSDEWPYK